MYQSFQKSVIDARKGPSNLRKPREYLVRRLKRKRITKTQRITTAMLLILFSNWRVQKSLYEAAPHMYMIVGMKVRGIDKT